MKKISNKRTLKDKPKLRSYCRLRYFGFLLRVEGPTRIMCSKKEVRKSCMLVLGCMWSMCFKKDEKWGSLLDTDIGPPAHTLVVVPFQKCLWHRRIVYIFSNLRFYQAISQQKILFFLTSMLLLPPLCHHHHVFLYICISISVAVCLLLGQISWPTCDFARIHCHLWPLWSPISGPSLSWGGWCAHRLFPGTYWRGNTR